MEEFDFYESMNKLSEKSSWNYRAKFLIIAYGRLDESPEWYSKDIFNTIKDYDIILDVVLCIISIDAVGNTSGSIFANEMDIIPSQNPSVMYAFTLFPYLNGSCNHQSPSLIAKWYLDNNNDYIFFGIEFFPSKIPNTFMGCTLKLAPVGREPFVIKENYVTQDGGSDFIVTGTIIEIISLFAKQLNFTLEILEPVSESENNDIINVIAQLQNHAVDIMTGFIPIVELIPSLLEFSFPYTLSNLKVLVPCPQAVPKVQRVLGLFSISTWIAMTFVLFLVTVTFWAIASIHLSNGIFKAMNNLSQSFSAAWAILLGVSVPVLPVSSQMRILFVIYVWYCFAISTIFQSYFTTYLVEPGYETRIQTYEDIKHAGIHFASIKSYQSLFAYLKFSELETFENVDYSSYTDCIQRTMFRRDSFSVAASFYPSYVSHKAGITDESKVVCYLDQSVVLFLIPAYLAKGNPLLGILNMHILHSLEGGLLNIYWSRLIHATNLRAEHVEEDTEYVVFNLTHLTPVFILLLFGYVLSGVVFLIEKVFNYIKKMKNSFFFKS
ncbi:hypothetical protein L9F63_005037 [Diploptera punctata]|uniref:Uncharacterized protein n=1 Tax=Diploptera punctata TaxID=6984 RepID=A0AAD7ZDW2_DIPPU|nr:hypothetical protein L9F63_005037 [Diploptera punctata]